MRLVLQTLIIFNSRKNCQIRSNCGSDDEKHEINVRSYNIKRFMTTDINAAINIRRLGLEQVMVN